MQFHVLSFEGPDAYARAGGIASRITGLSEGLAGLGNHTHLWFVGAPELAGSESRGTLHLHRWCQWISSYHPGGVYDGEFGKVQDYASSLPPYLLYETLLPHLRAGGRAAILAEEWHTVDAVLHLDWLLCREQVRDRVTILWNANNTFGFDRIDWPRLAQAAIITTVSRYMRHCMRFQGVDPIVIPNGIEETALEPPDPGATSELRTRFAGRTLLAKVARFDPDKRWLLAIDIVRDLKNRGAKPLLVARGGVEWHGAEVFGHAAQLGLSVVERRTAAAGAAGLVGAMADVNGADVVCLNSHLDGESRRSLFLAADAVLANSGHEPFGLVGLEAMAAGGVACTGCSGEDYAEPGQNALVLQTEDPREFTTLFTRLHEGPRGDQPLRRAAKHTARRYTWKRVIERALLPRV
jgi:glycosyltransferase involved in cell wall biosynthesis